MSHPVNYEPLSTYGDTDVATDWRTSSYNGATSPSRRVRGIDSPGRCHDIGLLVVSILLLVSTGFACFLWGKTMQQTDLQRMSWFGQFAPQNLKCRLQYLSSRGLNCSHVSPCVCSQIYVSSLAPPGSVDAIFRYQKQFTLRPDNGTTALWESIFPSKPYDSTKYSQPLRTFLSMRCRVI